MTAYEQDGAGALQAEIAEDHNGADGGAPRRSTARRLRTPLMLIAPLLIIAAAIFVYLSGGRYVSTDDAYVQSARVNISTNVNGRVVELDVHENQFVHAGDVLFRLDSRPFDTAVEQAQAQLAAARLNVQSTEANYGRQTAAVGAAQAQAGAAEAAVRTAQANLAYAEREYVRTRAMTGSGVSSQQQLSEATHNLEVARQQLSEAQQQLATTTRQVTEAQQAAAAVLATLGGRSGNPVDQNPAVQQARAALDQALLNESYTVIRAPQDGTVTRVEQLQVGDYVTAAQPLFALVAPRLWVDANFKEDQLTYMRPGQPATVKVDAYPGRTFAAHVASLSPGTGSAFSVLPPENATGNWVKVVQRLPVRLVFDGDVSDIHVPLAAGLSAVVKVDTGHRRTLFGMGRGAPARAGRPGAPR